MAGFISGGGLTTPRQIAHFHMPSTPSLPASIPRIEHSRLEKDPEGFTREMRRLLFRYSGVLLSRNSARSPHHCPSALSKAQCDVIPHTDTG